MYVSYRFPQKWEKISLLFIPLLFISWQIVAQSNRICTTDFLHLDNNAPRNAGQGVFLVAKKWLPGQKIKVKFLGGSTYVREKVKLYAQEWETHANIDFIFLDAGNAEIRISFQPGGSWSLIGKDALSQSSDQATMNFGWFNEKTSEQEFRRTTLHEFGHALGLLHEHQHVEAPFEWNVPVVMNDFVNGLGWTRDAVYHNYLERYGKGTAYSNKAYDKYSIMHYEIPSNHTKNGYAVGLNTQLSTGDKSIIKEMYPPEKTVVVTTNSDESYDIKDIEVDYGANQDGKKGMKILVDFDVEGVKNVRHQMAVYYYFASGTPLKDQNDSYRSASGNVAIGRDFTPTYDAATYTDFSLFIPYTELHLACGEFKLKFSISIWRDNAEKTESGQYYFSYWKCAVVDEVKVDVKHNVQVNGKSGMKIFPMFSIRHASNSDIKVVAYFYAQDGTKLKDYNDAYSTSSGSVAAWEDISPCCENTDYSMGEYYDFSIFIPYSELHLQDDARHKLKFFVSILEGSRTVQQSEWLEFSADSREHDKIYVENKCANEVRLLLKYKNLDDEWTTKGWFVVKPYETAYIEDTRSRTLYFYAESTGVVWKGNHEVSFKGEIYQFQTFYIKNDNWGVQTIPLGCN